ncbi:MAG: ECF-type sigma factor, partial [Phycisphaerae bacterium]
MTTPGEVTRVLVDLAGGEANAARKLLPLVYDELRSLADRYLRDERHDHTLQPTALVHEIYIRLVGRNDCAWKNRAQFFGVAAQAMRYLLIDHARRRRAAKRGDLAHKIPFEQMKEPSDHRDAYLIALDDALTELDSVDSQLGRVVELRFFGGLS